MEERERLERDQATEASVNPGCEHFFFGTSSIMPSLCACAQLVHKKIDVQKWPVRLLGLVLGGQREAFRHSFKTHSHSLPGKIGKVFLRERRVCYMWKHSIFRFLNSGEKKDILKIFLRRQNKTINQCAAFSHTQKRL